MSKELTPLEALGNIRTLFIGSPVDLSYQLNIIGTALKEYEEHEEILKYYGLSLADFRHACFTFAQFKNSKGFEGVEKKLKALEIIKKYPKVPIQKLIAYENGKTKGYDIGTLEVNDIPYTQEEYDLLKEVLL